LVNVATPLTAAIVVVPLSVPVPDAIDATTLTVELVTVFPPASVILITGWVVKTDPSTAPDGCVVIIALEAAPTLSAKLLEVAAVSDVGVKVNVKLPAVPERSRSVKLATPLTAATVVVPLNVPLPEAIDTTTSIDELVTVFPEESVIRITGWVVKATPLAAPEGCVVIIAFDAAPTFTVNTNSAVELPVAFVAVIV
jgi:uncharacterized membrane protein YfbV (UPF0208 family)